MKLRAQIACATKPPMTHGNKAMRLMGKWTNSNICSEVTGGSFAVQICQRCTFDPKKEIPYWRYRLVMPLATRLYQFFLGQIWSDNTRRGLTHSAGIKLEEWVNRLILLDVTTFYILNSKLTDSLVLMHSPSLV